MAATTCEAPIQLSVDPGPWTQTGIPPGSGLALPGLVRESFGHAAATQRPPEGDSVPRMAAFGNCLPQRNTSDTDALELVPTREHLSEEYSQLLKSVHVTRKYGWEPGRCRRDHQREAKQPQNAKLV